MKNLKSIALTLLIAAATSLITVSCSDDGMEDLKVENVESPLPIGGSGSSGEGGGTNVPPGVPCEGC